MNTLSKRRKWITRDEEVIVERFPLNGDPPSAKAITEVGLDTLLQREARIISQRWYFLRQIRDKVGVPRTECSCENRWKMYDNRWKEVEGRLGQMDNSISGLRADLASLREGLQRRVEVLDMQAHVHHDEPTKPYPEPRLSARQLLEKVFREALAELGPDDDEPGP